jgi:hypothetical protein
MDVEERGRAASDIATQETNVTTRRWSALLATLVVAAAFATRPASTQSTSVLMLIPTDGRQLEVGSDVNGALSTSDPLTPDDRYLEAWELRGRAGQSATVDIESDAFDPRVYVVGPGLSETLFADDGGGGCNARLTMTFLETGTFRVVTSSLSARETGTYRIRVSERPGTAPTYGCGEVNPDALNALPIEGRPVLGMGSLRSSRLGPLSRTVQDGRPAEAWRLQGRAGERVSIVMESDDFDTYLYLVGPGLEGVLTDDDGAGNLDAKIDVTLPTAGPFTVVAAALSSNGTGAYTLRVEPPFDPNTLSTEGRSIDLGQTVTGALASSDPLVADGRRGQAWAFEGVAGRRVTIDLSADYDTYLYLVGPGVDEPIGDDDGGGGTNSRIETTLPGTGTFRVIASSFSSGTGAYTLTVGPQ